MKLVILDRDGVINFDSAQFIKTPAEWKPIPGSRCSLLGRRSLCPSGRERQLLRLALQRTRKPTW